MILAGRPHRESRNAWRLGDKPAHSARANSRSPSVTYVALSAYPEVLRVTGDEAVPELRAARDPGRRERPAGRPAGLPLAQVWGGGLVAAADGMRVRRPGPGRVCPHNRKYFGSKRGMAWLNAINERGMGRGAPRRSPP